ncbi:hypothetical protein ACLBX9_29940 [Methylobacterium sp. A49B]
MTAGTSPEPLSKVLRLCTALAYRALDARMGGQPMPAAQAVALAKTARLLQDYGVEWPPLLAQALRELASEPESESSGDDELQGLALFFEGFRERDQS